jgi:cell fate regulator YaaT (PSP1 superfamily)
MSTPVAEIRVSPKVEDLVPVVVDPDLPAVPCRAGELEVQHDTVYLVETSDGQFLGRVSLFSLPIFRRRRGPVGRIIRLASSEDEKRSEDTRHIEREIEVFLRRRTDELALDMRTIKARLPLTGRKAVVYFTAERRLDFRPLLRELGRRFRRRVEMRPLGVRDGARVCGGLGPCGRCLCCSTFMDRFHSVTVRMAKRQNLSLNPTKISGLCGRLMCCLAHEVDQYPEVGRRSRKRT